jgi:hypothetical protein
MHLVSADYRDLVIADLADVDAELREHNTRVDAENRVLREALREAIHATHRDHIELGRYKRRVVTLVDEIRTLRGQVSAMGTHQRTVRRYAINADRRPDTSQGCPA